MYEVSLNRTGGRRREDGAAAVEFAIILSVLMLILTGLLEFGREYSRYLVFQGSAREGARAAAVGGDPATVVARVNEAADPYTLSETPTVSVNPGPGSQCTAETEGQSVTVSWNQTFQLNIAFWRAANFSRQIKGVFRCE